MRYLLLPIICAAFLLVACGGSSSSNDADSAGTGDIDSSKPEKELPEKELPDIDKADPQDDTQPDDAITDEKTDIDSIWAKADEDGDGIPNGTECPSQANCTDTDKDGTPDYQDTDSDNDGITDETETPNKVAVDTDKDGIPDYRDTDSDGDTIPDAIEGVTDTDGDGASNYRDTDSDGDAVLDKDEVGNDKENPEDFDGDTIPDYLDTDSDNDGVADIYEGFGDKDEDGIPNRHETDADNDGINDIDEAGVATTPIDTDEDGMFDFVDFDSDNDGATDALEKAKGSDPTKKDTDGDGVDDNTEIAYGSNPNDKNSSLPEGSYYIYLPYNDPAEKRSLEFSTDIRNADIVIMVDLSNSMSGEHANLKDGINNTIISGIKAKIPNAEFGLVKFGPINMNETLALDKGKNVYLPVQQITANTSEVQTAVNDIAVTSGTYEYITEAIYQTATGAGTYQRICHETNGCGVGQGGYEIKVDIKAAQCPSGRLGGLCLRDEALPIFILMTDEAFTLDFGLWKDGTAVTTLQKAIDAMNVINAKFIGLDSSGTNAPAADYTDLSTKTGSVDKDGKNFNQIINTDGSGMSTEIVDSVLSLTQYIQLDVSTNKVHIPNTFGVADTTQFITSITPGQFPKVKPGEKVTFELTFQNTIYDNTDPDSKLFTAKINVIGAGSILDSREVFVIVPGITGEEH